MPALNLLANNWQAQALDPEGPACLVIRAWLEPVAAMERFQPAGFPEIGHVIYDAPRDGDLSRKICIVDSPASMANHLETVCIDGPTGGLYVDLAGLPYVRCVTDRGPSPDENDPLETLVCTTMTEGHRLASDYFLDGIVGAEWSKDHWTGRKFRDCLREEFGVKEVKKDKTYFVWPETWWKIFNTIFKYDPSSLVHGVMFAKEQIKLSRMLTAHMEAFGATRVGSSGVKFDRLGKTTSGQPIFAVDEETAHTIIGTFILDLALLRSYGRAENGLNGYQKRLLLDLAIWKIRRLLQSPFRFRTGCQLLCNGIAWWDDTDDAKIPNQASSRPSDLSVNIQNSISHSGFTGDAIKVYYPAGELFKITQESDAAIPEGVVATESEESEGRED